MEKVFKKGETIIKEGMPGSEAYIITWGKVQVFRIVNGEKVVLATLGKDQIFGEMSMIDDRPRSASVIALEDTLTSVIRCEEFYDLCNSKPELSLIFLKNVFEKLRNIDQKVIDLASRKSGENVYDGKLILTGITPEANQALGNKLMEIKKFPFKIGRKTENYEKDMFSHNDLYLEDKMPFNVSRNHLAIQYGKEKFSVIDRGSTLGTFVNDIKIGGTSKINETELLKSKNNLIVLGTGESPFQFEISIQ